MAEATDLDLVLKLAGPAATVVAAFVAGGIAITLGILQWKNVSLQTKIANDKLALDVFDKRVQVYSAVRAAMRKAVVSGTSSPLLETALIDAIEAGRFIFDHDVKVYLDELYDHLIDFDYCNKALKDDPHLSETERATTVAKRRQHFNAIADFRTKADVMFKPYLSVTRTFSQ